MRRRKGDVNLLGRISPIDKYLSSQDIVSMLVNSMAAEIVAPYITGRYDARYTPEYYPSLADGSLKRKMERRTS